MKQKMAVAIALIAAKLLVVKRNESTEEKCKQKNRFFQHPNGSIASCVYNYDRSVLIA